MEIPLGINYAFPTRRYSNVKIIYLQLGELKAVTGVLWMGAALLLPGTAGALGCQGRINPPGLVLDKQGYLLVPSLAMGFGLLHPLPHFLLS